MCKCAAFFYALFWSFKLGFGTHLAPKAYIKVPTWNDEDCLVDSMWFLMHFVARCFDPPFSFGAHVSRVAW